MGLRVRVMGFRMLDLGFRGFGAYRVWGGALPEDGRSSV